MLTLKSKTMEGEVVATLVVEGNKVVSENGPADWLMERVEHYPGDSLEAKLERFYPYSNGYVNVEVERGNTG